MPKVNPKNKTKVAVVMGKTLSLGHWYFARNGLLAALSLLKDKYNIRIFSFTDQPARLESYGMQMQLVDNPSSLQYWLGDFDPKAVLTYGTVDTSLVVEATSAPIVNLGMPLVVDTDFYEDSGLPRNIPIVTDSTFENLPFGTVTMSMQTDPLYVHLDPQFLQPDQLQSLFNQAVAGITGDAYLAACMMACQTPVMAIEGTTAADVEGVWVVPLKDVSQAIPVMAGSFLAGNPDLRGDYIMKKYDHKTYSKKVLKILCSI